MNRSSVAGVLYKHVKSLYSLDPKITPGSIHCRVLYSILCQGGGGGGIRLDETAQNVDGGISTQQLYKR